ncbi:MAG: hypothetical protein GEU88_02705 [Solirubrobacterales bacterium]|nr:hypothetical protein [Solirubrobacterales bacterium]
MTPHILGSLVLQHRDLVAVNLGNSPARGELALAESPAAGAKAVDEAGRNRRILHRGPARMNGSRHRAAANEEARMGADENKALARRALEGVWGVAGGVRASDVYATGFISHQHSHPTVTDVRGIDALESFVAEFHRAFPDFTDTVERQAAEGDLVSTQFTSAGTHEGELMGIAPTGRRVEWMGIGMDRIEDGGSPRTGSAGTCTACSSGSGRPLHRAAGDEHGARGSGEGDRHDGSPPRHGPAARARAAARRRRCGGEPNVTRLPLELNPRGRRR